jgi:site-specific DNA recombinase
MTKRAVVYARVSYDDRPNEDRNLGSQIEDGRAYCQERGYRIVAELAEDDRGASGADWNLPKLNQALDMARAGEADVLVTRELDRFARKLAKQLVVEDQFRRYGVSVEYILAAYEDTPEGNLTKNVRAVIAEFEREKIAQRMTRGRRNVVKSGKVMLHGNKPPYGYRLEDGKLVIYDPEARIVQMIYNWYIYGDEKKKRLSIRAIAKRLTTMGVPTYFDIHREQGGYKKRGYSNWAVDTVSDILGNETYAGIWHYSKRGKGSRKFNPREHWLSLEVPAIVSREIWELAQERKKQNKAMSRRNTKYHYLMARRVTCGQCGYKMSTRTSRGKYGYYTCPSVDTQRSPGYHCGNGYFNTTQVDRAVWGWIKDLLLNPEALREDLEEQQAEQEQANKPLYNRLDVIDDLLADNRRQLERLLDLYLSGDFPKEVLTERKTRLETTIAALEKEQADLLMTLEAQTLSDDQIITITDFAKEVSEGLEIADQDFDARRQIIDLLDVQVTLATEEDGQKVIYARCLVDETELSIKSPASRTAP